MECRPWRLAIVALAFTLTLALSACAPTAPPTPAPTKPPAAIPTTAAAPTVAAAKPSPVAPTAAPAPPTAPAKLTTVRFGSPAAVSDAGIYIAIEKGYFRELMLEVEAVVFPSVAETMAPLAAGNLQVAGGTINVGLLNAIDRGLGLKIVASKGASTKGFEFARVTIRKDLLDSGQVKEVKDLKGRKFAVPTARAAPEANIAYLLRSAGLTINDIELVAMTFPDMISAYANKSIELAMHPEPTITAAVETGLAVRWPPGATSTIYGGEYQAGLLFFSEAFSKNTDAAHRFMLAYIRAMRVYNDAFVRGKDRDAIIAILAKYTPVKDTALYAKMEMPYLHPDGKLHLPSMKMDFDYFKQMGYYTGKLELEPLVDTQFMDLAAQQLGPYR